MRGSSGVAVLVFALALSGCAGQEPESDLQSTAPEARQSGSGDGPSTNGTLQDSPPHWPFNATHEIDGDEWSMDFKGRLPAGRALAYNWSFADLEDGYGVSGQVKIDSCGAAVEDIAGVVVRAEPYLAEGPWHLWFATDFEPLTPATMPLSLNWGSSGGSSRATLAGLWGTLQAGQDLCFSIAISGSDADRFNGTAPTIQFGNLTVTSHAMDTPVLQGPFTQRIERTGWTHVQRLPGCALPATVGNQMVYGDLTFPNGFAAHPGPTPYPSESTWFGTFVGVPGDLVVDIKSPWPGECLGVFDSDLQFPQFGSGNGYSEEGDRLVPPATWETNQAA